MTCHLLPCLVVAMALAGIATLTAAPPEKLKVIPPLPPFPDTGDEVLSPVKKSVELGPIPRTNDTNKPYDVIVVAPADGAQPAEGVIAVGFFNHGERDVLIEINNRTVKLASQYYLQMKLPREFTWREKEGPMQKTKVPAEADGLEIVFRR